LERKKKWQTHRGFIQDQNKGFDVIECEKCGFKHIVPIPTKEELQSVYQNYYYSIVKPLYIERYREDLGWWNIVYADRYETFEECLPTKFQRKMLDVGSGPGFYLLHGKERGWETLGIEPSEKAVAHSRSLGLNIIEGFLTSDNFKDMGTFDVIHMSEVLEHIPDPTEMISITNLMLNPGGLLCVVVPNDYSFFQGVLRTECGFKPWWVAPPHHINYFNFDSLTNLLERCGYSVFLKEATFPIDIFLLMGCNYIGNDEVGRYCHRSRMNFEMNLWRSGQNKVRRSLYQAFAQQGIGREIILYARKD